MFKTIKRIWNTLCLFIYCITLIESGLPITDKITFKTIEQLWQYCKKYEEGSL